MDRALNVLFSSRTEQWPEYEPHLIRAFLDHDLRVNLSQDITAEDVDYIVYAPSGPLQDFGPYTSCKAVFSLWAGVEQIVGNKTLTMPLARMVDPGLTEGMVEWVTGHVLRHHLGLDKYTNNPEKTWDDTPPPLAKNRTVGILGLGALGAACARALTHLNFNVIGWARTAKDIEGVESFSGAASLSHVLSNSDILVLLLPATPGTENTLNAGTIAQLKPGAVVINPGRGTLIDDAALSAALASGQVAGATLDVFRQEPLPIVNPYWDLPNVCVTPHIASATRPDTAAQVIAENIQRIENGMTLLNQVDRELGY